jgi:SAM-dependent methyltransferase
LNPGELEVMARVESVHWWYQGLRDLLVRTLSRPGCGLPAHPRVLDAGCGTGRNLVAVRDRFEPSYLGGFDISDAALRLARQTLPDADLYPGDLCEAPVHERDLDLVMSLDVLYIPGAERSRPGLERLVAALRPGGLLVLNLPAYDWLYSQHDVAVHTSERYTAGRIRSLLRGLGLQEQLLTYRLCLLFPLLVASRLPSLFRARPGDEAARSDLHRAPGRVANRVLGSVVGFENALIARGARLPFGSSVYAIGRKR